MTVAIAAAYVGALGLFLAGWGVRADPRMARRLGIHARSPAGIAPTRRRVGGGEIDASVPDLLDAVALSVSAGLTPHLALDRARAVVEGPLAVELSHAAGEVAVGRTWRQALAAIAERTGLEDLRRLAVTLDRGHRLGAPVAQQLRALAADVRGERQLRAEERARRAPVMMLFPLVFCILPAFVIAALVPMVLVGVRSVW